MNEPIISPWLVYLIGISESVSSVLLAASIVAGTVACVTAVVIAVAICDNEASPKWLFLPTAFTVITLTTGLACALIPSQEWIVATIIASETTPENIQAATQAGASFTESIKGDFLEIIQAIQGQPESPTTNQ